MAIAKLNKKDGTATVSLLLSLEEALVLRTITGKISGSAGGSAKDYSDSIYNTLLNLGFNQICGGMSGTINCTNTSLFSVNNSVNDFKVAHGIIVPPTEAPRPAEVSRVPDNLRMYQNYSAPMSVEYIRQYGSNLEQSRPTEIN